MILTNGVPFRRSTFRRLVPAGAAFLLAIATLYALHNSGIARAVWHKVNWQSGAILSHDSQQALLPYLQPEDRWNPPVKEDYPGGGEETAAYDPVYTNFTLLDEYAAGADHSQLHDSSSQVRPSPYDNDKLKATGIVPCRGPRGTTLRDSDSKEQVFARSGRPRNFARSLLGSTKVVGFEQDACYDRYSRWSPYGLEGGPDAQNAVDWDTVDWADVQAKCVHANQARFDFISKASLGSARTKILTSDSSTSELRSPVERTAIVFRAWQGAIYNADVRRNMRAVIQELALRTGGEYQAFILLQVKSGYDLLNMNADEKQKAIEELVPPEFRNITDLWSEAFWPNNYPLVPERQQFVHMSQWLPMQMFQKHHPEFDFYWNWEMDVRYTGHWYDMVKAVDEWSAAQPRKGLWERNERFYIPRLHGTWEQFRDYVQARYTSNGTDSSIWGPQLHVFPSTDWQKSWLQTLQSVQPPVPSPAQDEEWTWGVGEQADLTTFLPQVEPSKTRYVFEDAWWNYNGESGPEGNKHDSTIPRRTTVVTFSRLSARLLHLMELEDTVEPGHHMGSETWPQSLALHYGLKSVSVPHGIWMEREWPVQAAGWIFNTGDQNLTVREEDERKSDASKGGEGAGGRESVFGLGREHNIMGSSWYYEARLGEKLYKRWLGHEIDGVGGTEWEARNGLYCLPPMLLHPVKNIDAVQDAVH